MRSGPTSPFNLGGGEADPVSLLQNLIGRGGLAIDPDQIIGSDAIDALLEEFGDGGPFFHFNMVREASAIIIDIENPHSNKSPNLGGKRGEKQPTRDLERDHAPGTL